MSKQSGLMAMVDKIVAAREAQIRHHTRVYELDMVTAALGRMGFGEKRLREFDKMLTQVAEEYADLIVEDARSDKDLTYTKACLDRELKQYVGSMFVPYDDRYA